MFLQNLRAKVGARLNGDKGEAGFTLIELLVVMLILGILAAIALPAFFNQKSKAGDAKAKENAHSAQVAIETYSTDNNGSYLGAQVSDLIAIEPTIKESTEGSEGIKLLPAPTQTGYTIVSVSSTGNEFKVVNAAGTLTFPCVVPAGNSRGGCPTTNVWNE
jgi:type IV pilus assembly protein PilA